MTASSMNPPNPAMAFEGLRIAEENVHLPSPHGEAHDVEDDKHKAEEKPGGAADTGTVGIRSPTGPGMSGCGIEQLCGTKRHRNSAGSEEESVKPDPRLLHHFNIHHDGGGTADTKAMPVGQGQGHEGRHHLHPLQTHGAVYAPSSSSSSSSSPSSPETKRLCASRDTHDFHHHHLQQQHQHQQQHHAVAAQGRSTSPAGWSDHSSSMTAMSSSSVSASAAWEHCTSSAASSFSSSASTSTTLPSSSHSPYMTQHKTIAQERPTSRGVASVSKSAPALHPPTFAMAPEDAEAQQARMDGSPRGACLRTAYDAQQSLLQQQEEKERLHRGGVDVMTLPHALPNSPFLRIEHFMIPNPDARSPNCPYAAYAPPPSSTLSSSSSSSSTLSKKTSGFLPCPARGFMMLIYMLSGSMQCDDSRQPNANGTNPTVHPNTNTNGNGSASSTASASVNGSGKPTTSSALSSWIPSCPVSKAKSGFCARSILNRYASSSSSHPEKGDEEALKDQEMAPPSSCALQTQNVLKRGDAMCLNMGRGLIYSLTARFLPSTWTTSSGPASGAPAAASSPPPTSSSSISSSTAAMGKLMGSLPIPLGKSSLSICSSSSSSSMSEKESAWSPPPPAANPASPPSSAAAASPSASGTPAPARCPRLAALSAKLGLTSMLCPPSSHSATLAPAPTSHSSAPRPPQQPQQHQPQGQSGPPSICEQEDMQHTSGLRIWIDIPRYAKFSEPCSLIVRGGNKATMAGTALPTMSAAWHHRAPQTFPPPSAYVEGTSRKVAMLPDKSLVAPEDFLCETAGRCNTIVQLIKPLPNVSEKEQGHGWCAKRVLDVGCRGAGAGVQQPSDSASASTLGENATPPPPSFSLFDISLAPGGSIFRKIPTDHAACVYNLGPAGISIGDKHLASAKGEGLLEYDKYAGLMLDSPTDAREKEGAKGVWINNASMQKPTRVVLVTARPTPPSQTIHWPKTSSADQPQQEHHQQQQHDAADDEHPTATPAKAPTARPPPGGHDQFVLTTPCEHRMTLHDWSTGKNGFEAKRFYA